MLIVAALKDEVRDFRAKLAIDCTIHFKPSILYQGKLANKGVALLVTGIGGERMQKGLEQALGVVEPEAILLVGYAGGASPLAAQGALILGEEVIDGKSGKRFQCDGILLEKAKRLSEEKELRYKVGNIVTVDRVISNPHEKADLGATYSALALEMEAVAVAREASRRGIPFLVAKAILDPVEMILPDLQDCIESTGEVRPTKLMEQLFKNPKEMMQLPKMQYLAAQAREVITNFLAGWVCADAKLF